MAKSYLSHERAARTTSGAVRTPATLPDPDLRLSRHPRRKQVPGSLFTSPSNVIFTGTRCTTFTKFPVAFSAGMTLNRLPVPDWIDLHLPA